jgi:cytochrome c-type biogenesis protein CcmH/NrfG
MTSCVLTRQRGSINVYGEASMSAARSLILVFTLLCTATWAQGSPSPSAATATAAALKRDTARCRAYSDIDACYNAVRWNPGDPALLVALGDALLRAKRPADALRNYQRAAALAPTMHGLAAKISAAEAKLTPKQAPVSAANKPAAVKHYSNAAPETQSH